jgi:hypothetical protein
MVLTERQQQAAALGREIEKMGAFIVNPMPLDDSARLRFQVLDKDRDAVIEKLSAWDWSPALCDNLPRVCREGFLPAWTYSIDLPRPLPKVDDRKIYGEVFRGKTREDPTGILKYLGLDK